MTTLLSQGNSSWFASVNAIFLGMIASNVFYDYDYCFLVFRPGKISTFSNFNSIYIQYSANNIRIRIRKNGMLSIIW